GVVDGAVRADGERRVAGRVRLGELALATGLRGQARYLHVRPGQAAVEAGVRPRRAVVEAGEVAADTVVVSARHQVHRVARVHGDGGFVLRRPAAEVGRAAVVHHVADDRVDVGGGCVRGSRVEGCGAAQGHGRVGGVEILIVTLVCPRRVD